MKSILAKSGLALALGATAIASAAPAQAQRYDRHRSHRGGDATGAAIVGGILGLGIGAAIASSANRDRGYDRRYEDRYAYRGDVYDRYPQPDYYRDYRDGGYAYRGYDGYDRAPVCTVQRSWDRYSGRQVLVRVCR